MAGGFFRGTNVEQDQRFGDTNKKLLEQMSFSSLFKKRVDTSKVNMEAIKPWISNQISELLGIEDEVLHEYVVNMLEESSSPDPRTMQVNLTGFFEAKTEEFMQNLWKVLLEAQKSPGGIPESFIQKKIEELKRQRNEQEMIKAKIKAAEKKAGGHESGQGSRSTRAGRKSRWDAPSAPASDSRVDQKSDAQDRKQRRVRSPSYDRHSDHSRDRSRERHSRFNRDRNRSRSRSRSPRRHRRTKDDSRRERRDRHTKTRSRSPVHTKT